MVALEIQVQFPDTIIEIAVTWILALVVRIVLRRLIDRTVRSATERSGEHGRLSMGRATKVVTTAGGVGANRSAQRTKTLGSVLKSITDVILVVIVVLMTLNALNINIAPALASAGIVGVAVGFGAQSLFKDLFTGVFMLAEDQYGVGDIIEVNDLKGTVRSVGFRVTELQDFNGEVWYVRNGEINTVGNVSQGFTSTMVVIPVSVDESPKLVIRSLARMLRKMDSEPDWHNKMLEEPKVLGLSDLNATTASYQIQIKCPANAQWEVEREIRSRALSSLSQAGLAMPRTTVANVASGGAADTVLQGATGRHHSGRPIQQRVSERRQSRSGLSGAASTVTGASSDEGSSATAAQAAVSRTRRPADSTPADSQSHDGPAHDEVVLDDAPMPTVKAADSGKLRKARDWLDRGADRSVRWVSQGAAAASEVHDMTADQTVYMSADEILGDNPSGPAKAPTKKKGPGRKGSQNALPDAQQGSGDSSAAQTRSLEAIDPDDERPA